MRILHVNGLGSLLPPLLTVESVTCPSSFQNYVIAFSPILQMLVYLGLFIVILVGPQEGTKFHRCVQFAIFTKYLAAAF